MYWLLEAIFRLNVQECTSLLGYGKRVVNST